MSNLRERTPKAEQHQRAQILDKSFSPASPISDATLFAGRIEQRKEVVRAIRQTGQHVVIFGERGVGKTSLANILAREFDVNDNVLAVRVNCDSNDDFSSIWKKVFAEIRFTEEMPSPGFTASSRTKTMTLSSALPRKVAPNNIRKLFSLSGTSLNYVLILDEFDRPKRNLSALFTDTIKTLSDHLVPATLVLVGVADSVDELMKEHSSVERALVQVIMPRMSEQELREIVSSGLGRAGMSIEESALKQISKLSQGLPHYTHLLGLYAGHEANDKGNTKVSLADAQLAIKKSVEKVQESIKNARYTATVSPRRDNLFSQVLLACALARVDDRGFFAAADIKDPMARIMRREYDIPAFSRHLNDFCDRKRGPILQKTGTKRRYRFRFLNPLMQPFVIMHGLSRKLITPEDIAS